MAREQLRTLLFGLAEARRLAWTDSDNWSIAGNPGVPSSAYPGLDVTWPEGSDPLVLLDDSASLAGQRVNSAKFIEDVEIRGGDIRISNGPLWIGRPFTATVNADLLSESMIAVSGGGQLVLMGNSSPLLIADGIVSGTGVIDRLIVQSSGTVAPGAAVGETPCRWNRRTERRPCH